MPLPHSDEKAKSQAAFARLRHRIPLLNKPGCKANQQLTELQQALGIRVLVEPSAGLLLEQFPDHEVAAVLKAIVEWAANAPLKWLRVTLIAEPDDNSWAEVAFKIALDIDQDAALDLWSKLEDAIELTKDRMDSHVRALFDQQLRVHVLWGTWAEEAHLVE